MRLSLIAPLIGLWVWMNLVFATWRVLRVSRTCRERIDPLRDWPIQMFFRATSLVCLIVVLIVAN